MISSLSINTAVVGAGAINLNGVYTTGSQIYGTSGATGVITLGASGASDYRSVSAGAIAFYGPVSLDFSGGTIAVRSAGASGDDISFAKTLMSSSTVATSYTALALDAGAAGDISITGVTGNGPTPNSNRQLLTLAITSTAGDVTLGDVYTYGGQSISTTGALTLNGSNYAVAGRSSTTDLMSYNAPIAMTRSTTMTGGAEPSDIMSFGSTIDGKGGLYSLSIYAADLDFAGIIELGGALNIRTRTGATSIGLGSSTSDMELTTSELKLIRQTTSIIIGLSGTQTGSISAEAAQFYSGVTNLTGIGLYSDSGSGGIALNNTSAIAFDLNGNNVALALYSGDSGISSFGSAYANIAGTTGAITLSTTSSTAAASFGTSSTPLTFASGVGTIEVNNAVQTSGSRGALYLHGLSGLGFGTLTTGDRSLVLDTAAGDLSLGGQVSTVSGDQTYTPAGKLLLNFAGTVLSSSGSNITINSATTLLQDATISEGSGIATKKIWFKGIAATIDGGKTLSIDGGSVNNGEIVLEGAIGADASGTLASLQIYNASKISIADIGTAGQNGVSGSTTIGDAHATSIACLGSVYRSLGTQTWQSGTSASPGSLSTSQLATLWRSTSATTGVSRINIYGNFDSSSGDSTFISNDIGLNAGSPNTFGSWTLGTKTLSFYAQNPAAKLCIGYDSGLATDWNLDQSELASINNASFTANKIVFGESTIQTGAVNFRAVNLSAANNGDGLAVSVFSDAVGGTVSFDTALGLAPALNIGLKNLNVKAHTSISALQVPDGQSDIITTGFIQLETTLLVGANIGQGPVAPAPGYTSYYPIVIGSGNVLLNIAGKNTNGVYLMGNGAGITLGSVTIEGSLFVDSFNDVGVIYLADDIDSGGSSISFIQPVVLDPATGTLITIDSGGGNIVFAATVDGTTDDTEGLTLVSGTGDILVSGRGGQHQAAWCHHDHERQGRDFLELGESLEPHASGGHGDYELQWKPGLHG